jgi:murein DD-endopeptidase MepM/ murein hydrolase activator NlpD
MSRATFVPLIMAASLLGAVGLVGDRSQGEEAAMRKGHEGTVASAAALESASFQLVAVHVPWADPRDDGRPPVGSPTTSTATPRPTTTTMTASAETSSPGSSGPASGSGPAPASASSPGAGAGLDGDVPAASVTSAVVCPVQGEVDFIDSWGFPRSGGRDHKGVDMMAAAGTPTVAPVSGVVEHSSNLLGGKAWWLTGDDGHKYYGAHLSADANVGVGWVPAGTVIGYVGSTGNAAGGDPHLHFEVHPGGGDAVNPYSFVAAAC